MRIPEFFLYMGSVVACVSCSSLKNMNQPLEGAGEMNPLDLAGSSVFRAKKTSNESTLNGLMAGDYVETSLPNTAFYSSKPSANSQPQGVLAQGVVLKVVSPEGNFIQVQTISGEIGYVANAAVVPQGLLTSDVPLAPEVPPVVDPQETEPAPEPEIPEVTPPDASPIPAGEPEPSIAPEPEIPGIQE